MRRTLFWLAVGTLALSACAPRATPTTNVPTATPTPTTNVPTATPTPSVTCQAAPSLFASLSSINVPPVSDTDWARGPADAPATLIEYSDFQ